MTIILDSDVLIALLRGYGPAIAWDAKHKRYATAVPSIVIMEVQQGCLDKRHQQRVLKELKDFSLAHVTPQDSVLALQMHKSYALSHGMSIPDAFVAAIAVNRGSTLLTQNISTLGS